MSILVRPIITEKANKLSEKLQQYAFIVNPKANKIEIKKALETFYNVNIVDISTMIYAGKKKSKYSKNRFVEGKNKKFKKAIITLAEGEVIDLYENL
jgi:large subunit ribosomal protein L23